MPDSTVPSLPGGRIEEGESPRQAATRELLEESGQEPDGPLRFIGYARFVLAPDRRAEYAALFAGCATDVRDFRANEEIAAIRWWDLREALPGRVQPLDAYLARLTRGHGRVDTRGRLVVTGSVRRVSPPPGRAAARRRS